MRPNGSRSLGGPPLGARRVSRLTNAKGSTPLRQPNTVKTNGPKWATARRFALQPPFEEMEHSIRAVVNVVPAIHGDVDSK
ncbi:unnamed protein product, partial [Iphiclides podalirius]